MASKTNTRDLARWIGRQVRAKTLTLAQIAGLDANELGALGDLARTLRRAGDPERAASVLQLLLLFDPYEAGHWRAMAQVQHRLGNLADATACYECLALLEGRNPSNIHCEARCLQELGQSDLAQRLYAMGGEP